MKEASEESKGFDFEAFISQIGQVSWFTLDTKLLD